MQEDVREYESDLKKIDLYLQRKSDWPEISEKSKQYLID